MLDRRQPDLTVIAENIHKPRNFSALVRTCDSVGVHTIHAVHNEESYARHWHTAQGAVKWVHVDLHETVRGACETLKRGGFQVLAVLSEKG